jgi:hypothetical protein
MSKRNPNSVFSAMCTTINSLPVGSTYKVKELRDKLPMKLVYAKRGLRDICYTMGMIHVHLLTTGCIVRVKQGTYKIMGHIPDFVCVTTCEANRGYKIFKGDGTYKLRGTPWKLGDPEPQLLKFPKEKMISIVKGEKPKMDLNTELEKITLRVKNDPPKTNNLEMNIMIGKIHGMLEQAKPTEIITAQIKRTFIGVIILKISKDNPNFVFVKHVDGTEGKEYIGDLFDVEYATIPQREHSIDVLENKSINQLRKEKIVDILKQGLSASDAADLILKL